MKALDAPRTLAVHVGIATGSVVVRRDAEEAAGARLAVGATPNLAARLQGLAAPDEILIAPSTRRLIGNVFDLQERGAHSFKEIDDPVRVCVVMGLARNASRFEATHATDVLTPLVGRDEELDLLAARWRSACDGDGQLVLLCGEAGIGKSRLTHRLREQLGDDGHLLLRYQCSPYHVNSPLFPVVDQLERAADLRGEDTAERKLDKLEAYLHRAGAGMAQVMPLIAALLALPVERYAQAREVPQKQKELTLAALVALVEAFAAQQPVLVLLEDAHWIDAGTQEWLDRLVPRLQDMPCMLLMTFRLEYAAPWLTLGHATTHILNRLTRRQAAEMVFRLGGNRFWPPDVLEQIVANADGVPLFVEELTKSVLESGIVRGHVSHYELTGPLSPLAIPATLQDSLTARLDRLAPIKEVAQIGACIGREFGYALLAAVSDLPEPKLREALAQLVRAQLLFRQGRGTQESYVFKHALIQDAAYQSLVTTSRQRHHRRIAEALVNRFPAEVAARPEIVAVHCAHAGMDRQAFEYWQRAGELGVARSSYVEATHHFSAALALLSKAVPEAERDERELAIRVKLGPAYQVINGMGSPEAGQNYARVCEIGGGQKHSPESFQAL